MDKDLEKLFLLSKIEVAKIISQLSVDEVMDFVDALGEENEDE